MPMPAPTPSTTRDLANHATRHCAGGVLTGTAWSGTGDIALEAWLQIGQRFGRIGRGIGWWIGDWLRYGNARYGERYSRAARVTGYDPQTLMNMAYVASRFEVPRRREKLSWSHHAELAALPAEEQEYWLRRAEEEVLSVRCMRHELRAAGRAPNAPLRLDSAPPAAVCPECGCHFKPKSD